MTTTTTRKRGGLGGGGKRGGGGGGESRKTPTKTRKTTTTTRATTTTTTTKDAEKKNACVDFLSFFFLSFSEGAVKNKRNFLRERESARARGGSGRCYSGLQEQRGRDKKKTVRLSRRRSRVVLFLRAPARSDSFCRSLSLSLFLSHSISLSLSLFLSRACYIYKLFSYLPFA